MKKIMKKVVALAAVAALTLSTLVGCSSTSVNDTDVAATVGDTEITAGLLNFYVRFQQSSMDAMYSAYYGDGIWNQETSEGGTYAENLIDSALGLMEQLYILEDHMADYKVELTEEDLAKVEEAADAFVADNKSSVLEKISGSKENVAELLRLFTISDKMYDAIVADADTDIKDEEVAQKRMCYYYFDKTTTDEDGNMVELEGDEYDAVKAEVQAFYDGAVANGSMADYAEEQGIEVKTLTFDSESTDIAAEVIAAADKLAAGEFAEIIETEYYFFVAQLESEFDEEATATAKEELISTRESELYTEVVEAWIEETEISTNDDVIAQINVASLKITEPETEEE